MSELESTNSEWSQTGDFYHVELSYKALNLDTSVNFVRSPHAGAISTFIGTTRDTFEEKVVTHLSYEAYGEMAIEQLAQMCQEIRDKYNIIKITISHKLGDCPVGEMSVIIAISSAHRKDSLDAVSFTIDELKRRIPIWKKENYQEGDSTWKKNEINV